MKWKNITLLDKIPYAIAGLYLGFELIFTGLLFLLIGIIWTVDKHMKQREMKK